MGSPHVFFAQDKEGRTLWELIPVKDPPGLDVAATSSTTLAATITPAPGVSGPYTVVAVPVGGGKAIKATCRQAKCSLAGLTPGTAYSVTASGVDAATKKPSEASAPTVLSTPAKAEPPALEATSSGPTSLTATITPGQGVSRPYTVTATPLDGGKAITATCRQPTCTLTGLLPGTKYSVTATGTDMASKKPTAASAPTVLRTFPAPAKKEPPPARSSPSPRPRPPPPTRARAPTFDLQATSPTSILVQLTPAPGTKGPFTVTAAPVGGGSRIVLVCPTVVCALRKLSPGTAYQLTARGIGSTGASTAASSPKVVTTPGAGAPAVDAGATGATTIAVIVSPATGTRGPYVVRATPVGGSGGSPITQSCLTSTCTIMGLSPGTTYAVTATSTSIKGNGSPTPASAPAAVTTAQPGYVLDDLKGGAETARVASS